MSPGWMLGFVLGAMTGFGVGLALGVLACLWLYERGPARRADRL